MWILTYDLCSSCWTTGTRTVVISWGLPLKFWDTRYGNRDWAFEVCFVIPSLPLSYAKSYKSMKNLLVWCLAKPLSQADKIKLYPMYRRHHLKNKSDKVILNYDWSTFKTISFFEVIFFLPHSSKILRLRETCFWVQVICKEQNLTTPPHHMSAEWFIYDRTYLQLCTSGPQMCIIRKHHWRVLPYYDKSQIWK